MIWLRFAAVQLISLVATVVGWLLLVPFALGELWSKPGQGWDDKSIKDKRFIDRWRFEPLNWIYGNPEDGVSGQTALIWQGDAQVPYLPNAWAPWRAYLWSGWRNSADNLKYVFACPSCPLKTFTVLGLSIKIGWQQENGYNVPVLSIRVSYD